ncbi:hypothetical protein [Actinoplanes regularis]|uniref:Uncharacterized protein n=1 Tax=Actinoplanes regularis TaxID=52697 RepID=A0A239IEN1_9ACTN|nr:hypothetical protein [Actinoplanes regularis]GIE90804.1 hypothetical protein Are01nite_72840 [Actinoplanes regularis]SNS92011.1 hypothetical protein SAMN06264365_12878 [Actinoplanes regularis]
MITVDYVLSGDPLVTRDERSFDLAKTDLTDLCYSCFGGDLTLKIAGVDFSIVTGDGVQMLDFAVGFFGASRSVAKGESVRVDFAGMADEIYLAPAGEKVRVGSNYVEDVAEVRASELSSAGRELLTKLIVELRGKYPALARNKDVKKLAARVNLTL